MRREMATSTRHAIALRLVLAAASGCSGRVDPPAAKHAAVVVAAPATGQRAPDGPEGSSLQGASYVADAPAARGPEEASDAPCAAASEAVSPPLGCPAQTAKLGDQCELCKGVAARFARSPSPGSALADAAAECAYASIDRKLVAEVDHASGHQRYAGPIEAVKGSYEAALIEATQLDGEIEGAIARFGSARWTAIARARRGSLYDSCWTGLREAREPRLQLFTASQLQTLALAAGNPMAKEKADAFRENRVRRWEGMQEELLERAEPPMISLYAAAVTAAPAEAVGHPAVARALQRLSELTAVLGDAELRRHTAGVPGLRYVDGMFVRAARAQRPACQPGGASGGR